MLDKLVKKMHTMINKGESNKFYPIEIEAIELYNKVTAILYNEIIKDYEVGIHNHTMLYSLTHPPFEYLRYIFLRDKKIIVSDKNTPSYLSKEVNTQGRVVHDYIHYRWNYDFTLEGEYKTCEKQVELYFHIINKSKLIESGRPYHLLTQLLKQFIVSEVKVQALYYDTYGAFPPCQVVVFE